MLKLGSPPHILKAETQTDVNFIIATKTSNLSTSQLKKTPNVEPFVLDNSATKLKNLNVIRRDISKQKYHSVRDDE